MGTLRTLFGFAGLLAVVMIVAVPASANFQANQPNTSQGPLQQVGNNPEFAVGSFALTCTTLEKGQWHIQTKFSKVGGSPVEVKQDLTKDGPHEQFTGQYNGCTAAGGFEATVNSTCAVQVQQGSSTKGLGAVKSECIINLGSGTCVIKIPAGNSNFQLNNVLYGNIAVGQDIKSEVNGITETATGIGCSIAGITSGKQGEFKATVQAGSQKVE